MIAHLNHISDDAAVVLNHNSVTCNESPGLSTRQTSVNYYNVPSKQDPIFVASTLDQLDADQLDDNKTGTSDMLTESVESGVPPELYAEPDDLVYQDLDVFCFSSFSGPSVKPGTGQYWASFGCQARSHAAA